MKFETTPAVDKEMNKWIANHDCTEGSERSRIMYDFSDVGEGIVFSVSCICGADFYPVDSCSYHESVAPMAATRETLIKAIRSAYLTGIYDKATGSESWRRQSTEERAGDILQELIDDGEIEI